MHTDGSDFKSEKNMVPHDTIKADVKLTRRCLINLTDDKNQQKVKEPSYNGYFSLKIIPKRKKRQRCQATK